MTTLHPPFPICQPCPEAPPQPNPLHSLTCSPGSTALPCHPRQPSASRARVEAIGTTDRGFLLAWSSRRLGSRLHSRELRHLPRLPPESARAWRRRALLCDVPAAMAASEGMSDRADLRARARIRTDKNRPGFTHPHHSHTLRVKYRDKRSDRSGISVEESRRGARFVVGARAGRGARANNTSTTALLL